MKLEVYYNNPFFKKPFYLGEAIGFEGNKLYVQQTTDKKGRTPIMEVQDFEHKVDIREVEVKP